MNAPMPRQSIFPGSTTTSTSNSTSSSTSHLTHLNACLESLDHTTNVLAHTNGILSDSVSDVPRLMMVLQSRRHFDVVTESQVLEAKKQLEDEVRPHLKELLKRGEEEVERETANAKRVKNKLAQLTTRLEQVLATQNISLSASTASQAPAASLSTMSHEESRAIQEEQKRLEDLRRVQSRRRQLEQELTLLEEQLDAEMKHAKG